MKVETTVLRCGPEGAARFAVGETGADPAAKLIRDAGELTSNRVGLDGAEATGIPPANDLPLNPPPPAPLPGAPNDTGRCGLSCKPGDKLDDDGLARGPIMLRRLGLPAKGDREGLREDALFGVEGAALVYGMRVPRLLASGLRARGGMWSAVVAWDISSTSCLVDVAKSWVNLSESNSRFKATNCSAQYSTGSQ
mmetsp:Transcript_7777/g.18947  ORF Transcript_7777/g.18947 Transcript_7777/m.18947 type:complete len:195 (+) Transcript_7777:693-1277(+)